jgi:hypothetical protein
VFTPFIPVALPFAPCFLLEALRGSALLRQTVDLSFGFGKRKVLQTLQGRSLDMQQLQDELFSVQCFFSLDPLLQPAFLVQFEMIRQHLRHL